MTTSQNPSPEQRCRDDTIAVSARWNALGSNFIAGEQAFQEMLDLIRASRDRTLVAVNSAIIDLYWKVGELVARKIHSDGWGKGTVAALSYIQKRQLGLHGFSPQNLWRSAPRSVSSICVWPPASAGPCGRSPARSMAHCSSGQY